MILFASLAVFACDKISGSGPKEILSNYLDASLKGRYEEAYLYVSAEDKSIKNLQSYLKENSKKDSPFTQAIASKISFKILKLEKTEKTASADVEVTLPDFGAIMADVMGAAFKSAFDGGGEKEVEALMRKKFESGKVPLTTKKETFNLRKESDGWKVFLDWKSKKEKEEKQITISNLITEAKKLRQSRNLESAIQKYEKVLELDSEMVDAQEGIDEVKTEIKKLEEKQAYIENVVLYDLQSKYYETYLEKKVPGVKFKIRNKGDRSLKEVEVTVYFKDTSGKIIAEKSYYPVLITKYSFGGDNKPLKPNYIWQMESSKFYKADSVPSEWKEGSVSAKITNIEFE